MNLPPDAERARKILEDAFAWDLYHEADKAELFAAAALALGHLRGYLLPKDRLDGYRCSHCGAGGVKLWRASHSAREAWCARCGTAQAGLPDDIDDEGRRASDCGRSDQIYSPHQGDCLLPYVPAPDGGTWGYTSVPPEGVLWWVSLPTRRP